MAYDEGLAQILRDDLSAQEGITEKKMFGGIAFMLYGHMLCGVHKGGGMFRVGKENDAEALKIDGVGPMDFTGRPMSGFVDVADETIENEELRSRIMEMARSYVMSLPAK